MVLDFRHLFFLHCVKKITDERGKPPTMLELWDRVGRDSGYINETANALKVDEFRMARISNNRTVYGLRTRLINEGYLFARNLLITEKGRAMLYAIGPDWKQWPEKIEMDSERNVTYRKEF